MNKMTLTLKVILGLLVLSYTTLGYTNKKRIKNSKTFHAVSSFPLINDSAKFISELRKTFDLTVDENTYQKENEKITAFKKGKLYGSNKDFFFIEYDYKDGCGAAFPWKYQLLLTPEGNLVKTMAGQRYDFIQIFPNQNPFLLLLVATSKGNGGHEIYKVTADTLENVYDGFSGYFPRTYDDHDDNTLNEPCELNLKILDDNNDGFNDIIFSGLIISSNKKTPVKFIFIYNKTTGHFTEKEDYSKKYMYLEKEQ